jgi:hypothetical protein
MAESTPTVVELDERIRAAVLVPITLSMFLIGLIRHFFSQLARSDRRSSPQQIRESQSLLRSQRFRASANLLSPSSFHRRTSSLLSNQPEQQQQQQSPQQQMLSDPTMMTDMLKRNVGMVIPQMITGGFVHVFISGFVVAKVPFPLTQRFRLLLQRGVDVQDLDVTYVSSLSWYFLNLFGLGGVRSLVLGDSAVDDTQLMQQQMQIGTDSSKAISQEREALSFIRHSYSMPHAEERAHDLLSSFTSTSRR